MISSHDSYASFKAEVEEILEAEWMVGEDNFRKFLNDLEKAYV